MTEEYNLGKTAYEAYCVSVGGVSAVSGAPLPLFHKTTKSIQEGWIAAANAVKKVCNE